MLSECCRKCHIRGSCIVSGAPCAKSASCCPPTRVVRRPLPSRARRAIQAPMPSTTTQRLQRSSRHVSAACERACRARACRARVCLCPRVHCACTCTCVFIMRACTRLVCLAAHVQPGATRGHAVLQDSQCSTGEHCRTHRRPCRRNSSPRLRRRSSGGSRKTRCSSMTKRGRCAQYCSDAAPRCRMHSRCRWSAAAPC